MYPVPEQLPIPSVAELNRDMENFVIQASSGRNKRFKDPYQVLQFVHFTDIHYMLENWNRIIEYVNTYSEYIQFALHSGDYCGCSQTEYFCNLYKEGIPCVHPVLNCTGNHDCIESYANESSTPKEVHQICFPKGETEKWGVTFIPGEYPLSYYKDFPESNLRMIVLDAYYVTEEQKNWLEELLDDAREKGIHVITVAHEMTNPITNRFDVPFQTLDNFFYGLKNGRRPLGLDWPLFDPIIAEFKKKGGMHVVHLAGNEHCEYFGFTDGGVLNSVAPCGTYNTVSCDCLRVRGTRSYDSFNVVAVDTNLCLLKIIRIGNDLDHYLRQKKVVCWDYKNEKLISSL